MTSRVLKLIVLPTILVVPAFMAGLMVGSGDDSGVAASPGIDPKVMGVDTVAVRDTVTIDGDLLADTSDWYAQDRAGNVWCFGEAVKYEDGRPVADETSRWASTLARWSRLTP